PFTLFLGLFFLSWAHLDRGDFARAARILERCLDLGRTWQFDDGTPDVAAVLGYAYGLAGRTEESLALVAGAVTAFRAGRGHVGPGTILLHAVRVIRDLPWSGGRTGGRDRDVGRNAGIAGWSLRCYPPRTLARRDASKFATPFRMNASSSSLVIRLNSSFT